MGFTCSLALVKLAIEPAIAEVMPNTVIAPINTDFFMVLPLTCVIDLMDSFYYQTNT
jgi:hypothetical protein